MKFTPSTPSGSSPPSSRALPEHKFLLYCTDGGQFILKLQGDDLVCECDTLAEAVALARQLRPKAALTIYDALGRVVLSTFL